MTIKLLKKYLKSLWVIKKLVLHHGKKTQVIEREWWAMTGSNRRHSRCKRDWFVSCCVQWRVKQGFFNLSESKI